jgi:hypothetical protein
MLIALTGIRFIEIRANIVGWLIDGLNLIAMDRRFDL